MRKILAWITGACEFLTAASGEDIGSAFKWVFGITCYPIFLNKTDPCGAHLSSMEPNSRLRDT